MRRYHRVIFFTKTKLGGFYKYKDIFQIFPMELENMPTSDINRHHPNILEFWVEDQEKISLSGELAEFEDFFGDSPIIIIKQEKIFSLLTSFTNNHFFRYDDTTGTWGIPFSQVNNKVISSEWILKLFHFSDLPRQFNIEKFTELGISEIKKVDHKKYFTYYPSQDYGKEDEIFFPSTIDFLFDSYYSLEPQIKEIIDTASSYIVSSVELKDRRKTLALLTLFTALEAMVNLEYINSASERCNECGQLKFSISMKFREFLLKYVGNSDSNRRKFNKLYTLRSKIVHAGRQLKTEQLFSNLPSDVEEKEILQRIELLQITKLSIANWLLLNHDR